jgi:hypothetical protein
MRASLPPRPFWFMARGRRRFPHNAPSAPQKRTPVAVEGIGGSEWLFFFRERHDSMEGTE